MSNNFVTRQNQAHREIGHPLLCLVNDLLNQSNFVQQGHWLLLFIKQTSSGVPQLDNEDVLLQACFDVGLEEDLEERLVLAETANSGEFVLEVLPNFVTFKSGALF